MGNRKLWLWFLGLMTLYFSARLLRIHFDAIPIFFKYYFTDLLFIPTVSIFALIFVRLIKRNNTILISAWLIGVLIVWLSLYFEWYLPTYKSHIHPYTSDWIDVLMYCFGGLLFLWMQKKIFQPE
jgi:hypothetical protein